LLFKKKNLKLDHFIMSSSSVPLSFSPELLEDLEKIKKGSKRVVKIEIKNEVFVNTTGTNGADISKFESVAGMVAESEPCYVLYKVDTANNKWIIVIWMPDGVKVRDRMIYASAADTIKKEFGYDYFLEDFQASTKEDFDDSSLQVKINPTSSEAAMSEAEKMLADVKKEEEETRIEQQKLYEQRKGSKATTAILEELRKSGASEGSRKNSHHSDKDEEEHDESPKTTSPEENKPAPEIVKKPIPSATKNSALSKPPTTSPTNKAATTTTTTTTTSTTKSSPTSPVATPKSSPTSPVATPKLSVNTSHKPISAGKLPSSPPASPTGKGGLYQEMGLPLDDKAISELQRWKKGEVNWVELAIEKDKKEKVELVSSKQVENRNLSSVVNASEARYYMFTYSATKKVNLFIYCCPDNSQRQFRMIYATAKNSVPAAAAKLGITIDKKLEISTPGELTEDFIKSELSSKPIADTGRSSPSPKSVIKESHPIYGLMAGGNSGGPTKKKIVMPPSGAYC